MNYEIIRYVIIGAIVLGVTMYILKSFIKAALIAMVIVILFKVGWVYTGDDVRNSSFLNNILHPEAIESVIEKYDLFAKRRDSLQEKLDVNIEESVKDEIGDKIKDYLNKDTDSEDLSEEGK